MNEQEYYGCSVSIETGEIVIMTVLSLFFLRFCLTRSHSRSRVLFVDTVSRRQRLMSQSIEIPNAIFFI